MSDDRDLAAGSYSEHFLRLASAMGASSKIAKIVGCVSTVEGRPTSGRCQWERLGPEREGPTRLYLVQKSPDSPAESPTAGLGSSQRGGAGEESGNSDRRPLERQLGTAQLPAAPGPAPARGLSLSESS